MLTWMIIGCGVAGEVVRPTVDADAIRHLLRDSCTPLDGRDGFWVCEAGALAQVEHALVDLKWDLIDCDQERAYLGAKCLIKVERLQGELASCEHDPWCLGPIVGGIALTVGFLCGGLAF